MEGEILYIEVGKSIIGGINNMNGGRNTVSGRNNTVNGRGMKYL